MVFDFPPLSPELEEGEEDEELQPWAHLDLGPPDTCKHRLRYLLKRSHRNLESVGQNKLTAPLLHGPYLAVMVHQAAGRSLDHMPHLSGETSGR